MNKTIVPFLSAVFLAVTLAQASEPLKAFDLKDVRLLDSPFKHAEEMDVEYILEMDVDRLLSPFLREAGLHPSAQSYSNWENTGLDGHIGGHYLSALAMMYASTGDERMKERLDYMVAQLKEVQEANGNGYIGGVPNGQSMWDEIKRGDIRAGAFGLNDRWVPLYNIHKTYSGLRDAYLFGKNEDAKDMLIAFTDWMIDLTKDLSDAEIQRMLISEHGGLNETFADVAAITGDDKYMELARRFSDHAILDPLLKKRDELTNKHANTQIPKVIGYKRIADLDNDEAWDDAAEFFWDNVVNQRSVSIGGNSRREHFHPINDYTEMIEEAQGPETCNTYNMLKLSKMLFLTDPQDRYMEFYERALYNHILTTQDPETGGLVYFTPMRPGHYRVYSQPHECFWCCVGSGIENHAKYGEMIYAHSDDELYVNLFIASQLKWEDKNVMVAQQTSFPDEPKTTLTIKAAKPTAFTLKLRYPEWVRDGGLQVSVNGEAVMIQAKPGEYISIERTWTSGDKVDIDLPMHIEAEQLPDGQNYYSFRYGPIVLAAKTTDNDMPGLFAGDARMDHVAQGEQIPLNEMPMIIGDPERLAHQVKPVAGEPLTFEIANLSKSKYKDLELMPFFRVHESRYIIYWRQETPENAAEMQEKLAKMEAARQKLNAATIDMVYPGEQQPESDHFIKTKNSNMGAHMGRHWRDATDGWFSYDMNDKQGEAKKLLVVYFGADRNRNFKILVNDVEIASVKLNGSHGNNFFSESYTIPEAVLTAATDGKLVVKFESAPGSIAGGVFEVRLMK